MVVACRSLIGMVAGFIVWSAYFAALYSVLSVGCAQGLDQVRVLGVDAVWLTLVLLTLITLIAIASFGWHSLHAARTALAEVDATHLPSADFMALTAALLAALALVATAWVALPLFFLPTCTSG